VDRVRFQLDEHVPLAVARALQSRGIDASTAAEAGLLGASDEVLDRTSTGARVLANDTRPGARVTLAMHKGEDILPKTLLSIMEQAGLSREELLELL